MLFRLETRMTQKQATVVENLALLQLVWMSRWCYRDAAEVSTIKLLTLGVVGVQGGHSGGPEVVISGVR